MDDIFNILDNDHDGYIDPNYIDLRNFKDHVRKFL